MLNDLQMEIELLKSEIQMREINLYNNQDINYTPSEYRKELMRLDNLTMKLASKQDKLNYLMSMQCNSSNNDIIVLCYKLFLYFILMLFLTTLFCLLGVL